MRKNILIVLLSVVTAFLVISNLWTICMYTAEKKNNVVIRITDTLIISDTIHDTVPMIKHVSHVRYDTIVATRTDTMTDTVHVFIPIESKCYSSDDYRAWVSGYKASLDSIDVYQKTVYMSIETKAKAKTRIGVCVGPYAGIDKDGWSVGVSINAGYILFGW